MPQASGARIEIGIANRPAIGGSVCCHAALVVPRAAGTLIGMLDAIGTGTDAAATAEAAAIVLRAWSGEPLAELLHHCHRRLRGTRGLSLALALVPARRRMLSWLGVGAVQALVHHRGGAAGPADAMLLVRGGVVGINLPLSPPVTLGFAPGDTLLIAGGGIRRRFADATDCSAPPQQLANRLLLQFGVAPHDAIVVAARRAAPPARA